MNGVSASCCEPRMGTLPHWEELAEEGNIQEEFPPLWDYRRNTVLGRRPGGERYTEEEHHLVNTSGKEHYPVATRLFHFQIHRQSR